MVDLNYSASVQPEELPGRAYPRLPEEASPGAFPHALGRGVEEAGEVMQQGAHAAMEQARVTQATQAHTAAQQAMIGLLRDPNTGAFTKEGKNAFGLPQQYLPQFDQQAKQILGNVRDPVARARAQNAIGEVRNSMMEQLDAHEIQQTKVYNQQTAVASIKTAQEAAGAGATNANIISQNLETIDSSLRNRMQQEGWSPQEFEMQRYNARLGLHEQVLQTLVDQKHYDMAAHYLNQFRGELKPHDAKVADEAIAGARQQGMADSILNQYRTGGVDAGAKALERIKNSGLDLKHQESLQEEVNRGRALYRDQLRQDPAVNSQLQDLYQNLIDGNADVGLSMNERLWKQGAISDEEHINNMHLASREQEKIMKRQKLMAPVADAVLNGRPLDPKISANREGMNWLFRKATEGMEVGSAAWRSQGLSMGRATGTHPPDLITWATGYMMDLTNAAATANPRMFRDAASVIVQAHEVNGYGIDAKTYGIASKIQEYSQAGVEAGQALNIARSIQEMKQADFDAREKAFSRLTAQNYVLQFGGETQIDALHSKMQGDPQFTAPGFLWRQAPPSQSWSAAQGDFDKMTKDFFLYNGGDLAGARKAAFEQLRTTWGISSVNGKPEIMRYPPERTLGGRDKHGNVVPDTHVPELIRADLAKEGHPHAKLIEIPHTTSASGGMEWWIGEPDPTGGLITPVVDEKTGQNVKYTLPDFLAEGAASKREQQAAMETERTMKAAHERDEMEKLQKQQLQERLK